jgi:hypothetical protein
VLLRPLLQAAADRRDERQVDVVPARGVLHERASLAAGKSIIERSIEARLPCP